jgi:hypothetical protein
VSYSLSFSPHLSGASNEVTRDLLIAGFFVSSPGRPG